MGLIGNLGSVIYDIIANDKTKDGIGSAQKGFGNLVTTLGDLKQSFQEIDGVAQQISHGYASLSSYAEQAALSTGLTSDATSELIKELWSVDTPLNEAGNLIIELGRAGLTSAGDIKTVGTACDTLGDALGVPADTLANMLIPAFQAFGMEATDIPSNIDQITYTLKNCNVNFDEWSKTLVKLGPDLGKMGLSLTDVNALLLVMKDHGYQGRNMLSDLTTAMGESSDANQDGVVSLEEMAAALGITVEELEAQKDALGNSQGSAEKWADAANRMYTASDEFSQAVEELSTNLGPLSESLAAVTGPGTMVANFLLSLAALKTLGIGASIGEISTAFTGLGASLTGLGATLTTGLVAALTSLPALIGAGIILGLAGVWVLLETGVLDWLSGVGRLIEESDLGNVIMNILQGVLWPLGSLGALIIDIVSGQWDLSVIADDMAEPFRQGMGGIGEALGGMSGILSGAFTDITTAFAALGGNVQTAFSNLFTGISDFIVTLGQGFIAAGYNIIMFIIQGMQSATGAIGDAIGGIFGFLSQFIPHSPAERGPLSQLPNFSAYLVDPLLATVPQVQAASLQVAEAAVMPVAQPTSISGGTTTTSTDDHSMNVGTINAGKEQSISDIMAEIAMMQAQKRTQRGYTS